MGFFGGTRHHPIIQMPYASKGKTAFVKFKFSNNLKQNIDETDSKQQ